MKIRKRGVLVTNHAMILKIKISAQLYFPRKIKNAIVVWIRGI